MPSISVIIPLFDKENYIERAIDSVLAQTFQDFEIIVVDDGSKDGSLEIVQQYKDERLRILRQQNPGPGAARNRGIKESAGSKYLAFLDADDEWLPDFLIRYLDALRNNPDCDYVIGPYYEGDLRLDRSEQWRKHGIEEGAWRLPLNLSHTDLHQYLTQLHYTCAMLCKRSIIEKYNGFFSEYKCTYGEDRYLQLQMLLNHQIYRIIKPLVWYHKETSGISSFGSKPRPLIPILTHPEPLRTNCPQKYREVFEWYLASHALGYAQEYANINDFSTALVLMRRFPLMKKNKRKYLILLVKIILAKMNAFINRISRMGCF